MLTNNNDKFLHIKCATVGRTFNAKFVNKKNDIM